MVYALNNVQAVRDAIRDAFDGEAVTVKNYQLRKADLLIEALAERIRTMSNALEEIVSPLSAMQSRADAEGYQLDGCMALAIANDPKHLQQIARAALATKGADSNEHG